MDVDGLLRRQHGVLSLDQALDAGLGRDTIQRRVSSGAWRRPHPRTYQVGSHPVTGESRIWAAALWVGRRGVVAGRAAAFWQGLPVTAPEVIDMAVSTATRLSSRPGITLYRRDLDPDDIGETRGLRVVAAPLAALQMAAVLDDGATFLDRVLQRHVPFWLIYDTYCRNLGARGWSRVSQLLIAAADRADSASERRLVKLLRDFDIVGWVLGYQFGPYKIDVAFPAARVAVEVDGWAFHSDAERFRNDRHKGNKLTTAGWIVLRFTWQDLVERPYACIAEIRAALARVA